MLNDKKTLTNILNKMTPERIVNTTYTTGTANTWVKSSVTFTIPTDGIYRFRAPFTNTSVYGIARAATTATDIASGVIIQENTTGNSIDALVYMQAGTWALWTKCGTASRTNNFEVIRVL